MSPDLLIDPAIKLWVLVPILVVMVLVGLGRHYASVLLAPNPPVSNSLQQRERAYLAYSNLLRENAFNLGLDGFARRATPLVSEFKRGEYLADPDSKPASLIPNMLDPQSSEAMFGSVRQQVLNYVPQALTMQWVTSFFGSFVVMKLPFPLTSKFKEMVQANLNTNDLDVRWVSSISWYILLLLGLNGVYSLILGGGNEANGTSPTSAQGLPAAIPANADKKQAFISEAEALELEKPKSVLIGVCERIMEIPI